MNVGSVTIDVSDLKTKYPNLEPISLQKYSYADVDMILGPEVFHFIRALEYFESNRKNTPVAVRIPLSWVLAGPLRSTSGFYSTCFKALSTNKDVNSDFADQLCTWYDKESFGAFKQVDSRSAADARAEKVLHDTTYHDGSRNQVGTLWAEDKSSLQNNYFSALFQLNRYSKTIQGNFSKGNIVNVDKSDCFKVNKVRELYRPHHPVVHPHKAGKIRRVLNGVAKF